MFLFSEISLEQLYFISVTIGMVTV